MADHFALIDLTSALAMSAGVLPAIESPVRVLFDELTGAAAGTDQATEAHRYVAGWRVSRSDQFFSCRRATDSIPHSGFPGRWDLTEVARDDWHWLGLFPHIVEEVLKGADYEPKSILKTWHERGWLETSAELGITLRQRVGGVPADLSAIKRIAIERVMGPGLPEVPMPRGSAT